jgi:hypothetical protein
MTTTALSDVARVTTIEALGAQLRTDAERLAELAQTMCETPTKPLAVIDALNCAELVAATANALTEMTA